MQNLTPVQLTRDCPAVQIPHGTAATLPKGTEVDITQTLGGTFTVRIPAGLFRIAGEDADALGLEKPEATPAVGGTEPTEVNEDQVWTVLKSCFDPEIPVNIVDLGLIYNLNLETLPGGRSKVEVKMTLTAPGCGMGGVIAQDAQQKLLMLDGVEEASVEVVWDPPWHQTMITPEGRRALGIE
jgi:probable FeS assembly SUF system protein SufT